MKWLLAIAAVLGVAGFFLWQGNSGVPVDAATAQREQIREFIDEQAITTLPREYLITMPFNGRIEAIELAAGSPVKAGQVVARIIPQDLELKVSEAQSAVDRLAASIRENDDKTVETTALEQSLLFVESMDATVKAAVERVKAGEAKLNYANTHLRRVRSLRETGAATEDQFNRAELDQVQAAVDYQQDVLVLSALKSMQAATVLVPTLVRQYIDRKRLSRDVLENEQAEAQARLARAVQDQKRGEMKSDVDGVVLERLESNEREVAAGTVLLRIGRLEQLEIEAEVLSQDVVRVKPGAKVDIYGPAIGPKPVEGTVQRIDPAGFTKVSTLGVEQQRVKVAIAFKPEVLAKLRQNHSLGVDYRVRTRIYTADKADALVVPRAALFRGPAGQWQTFAVRGGVARLLSVEVGLMNDDRAELTGGLADGDIVILAPEGNLQDGTRVRPVGASGRP